MFGRVMLIENKDFSCIPSIGCLGPEPLSKDFNEDWLYEKLHNRKAPIKSLLLDQRIACGVGNIYADEACFRAGISPLRLGKDLNKKEMKSLSESIKFVLRNAIKNYGTTIRDYRTSEGKAGSGKTTLASQIALDLLFRREIEQVLIARPFVTAGEDIGFLPGGVDQKLEYLTFPIYDLMNTMTGDPEK
jgi:ribosomal protein S13